MKVKGLCLVSLEVKGRVMERIDAIVDTLVAVLVMFIFFLILWGRKKF
jgi:VanZ family protein